MYYLNSSVLKKPIISLIIPVRWPVPIAPHNMILCQKQYRLWFIIVGRESGKIFIKLMSIFSPFKPKLSVYLRLPIIQSTILGNNNCCLFAVGVDRGTRYWTYKGVIIKRFDCRRTNLPVRIQWPKCNRLETW